MNHFNLLTKQTKSRAISSIQVAQKSDGKTLAIDLLPKRHCEGDCRALQFPRKIFAALIHIDPDAGDSQMRCFFLGAHLYQDAGDLAPIDLHVVWKFNCRLEREFVLDCTGNSFRRPGSESR